MCEGLDIFSALGVLIKYHDAETVRNQLRNISNSDPLSILKPFLETEKTSLLSPIVNKSGAPLHISTKSKHPELN